MGRARRAEETEPADPASPAFEETRRVAPPPADAHGWLDEEDASRSDARSEQQQSLPDFFDRLRK
jgi:hypothetical protein